MGYANVPTASGAGYDDLDTAIRELSDYLNRRIPKDSKVVFLNVKSDWPDFSEYILFSLIENGVNDEMFTVVDRQQLDLIRSELNFQWSGEVSDTSAQEIGQMLGAQTIVSGSVTEVGSEYRIQVRAISVLTAALQGLSSQNINRKGPLVTALTTAPAAAAAREMKKEEDARKKQAAKEEDARKREEATDNFLKNSGINFGGWFGFAILPGKDTEESEESSTPSFPSGGGEIGVRLFRYFGLQTGFSLIQDMDASLSNPVGTQTILQIPVLVRLNLPIINYNLSPYTGIGINVSSVKNNVPIQSSSKFSFIAGGDIGISLGILQASAGYQYNRDLTNTTYSSAGGNSSYLGERHLICLRVGFYIPFRNSDQ